MLIKKDTTGNSVATIYADTPLHKPLEVGSVLAKTLERIWRGHDVVVDSPPGAGKALALDTPLPTPTGWTTMGDVQIGDQLIDEQGNPCTVTFKSEIFYDHDCFEVSTDDGESVIADADHLWPVMLENPKKVAKQAIPHYPGKTGPILRGIGSGVHNHTTRCLAETPRSKRPRLNLAKPLELPHAELPIDPYVLGAWLGDGTASCGAITSSVEDQKWMRQFIEEAGYVTTERKDPITIGILGLQKQLRVAGLLNNKHIPDAYFRASKEQRLALLQGLIDTDGHVAGERHGMIEFMSTKLNLAQGVQFLARSLGVKASLSEGRATLNGRDCGPKYRVTFYLEGAARLPRKAMSTCNGTRTNNRYLTVTPVASVPTQCIQVDSPNHLFLCGNGLMVTHNTSLIVDVVEQLTTRTDMQILVCAFTRAQVLSLYDRIYAVIGDRVCLMMSNSGRDAEDIKGVDPVVVVRTLAGARIAKDSESYDLMIVDEAYQATYAAVIRARSGIPQLLMVGDPGQIGPVITVDTSFWKTGHGPFLPAPSMMFTKDVARFALSTTYRLGPVSAGVVAPLYDFKFESACLERELVTVDGQPVREVEAIEVPRVETADDINALTVMAHRARALTDCGTVAAIVSRNSQATILTAMLHDYPVRIGTADRLQGGEWTSVVALDPMMGEDNSEHAQSLGRLCVMASRHTTHLTWIHDDSWQNADDPRHRQVRKAMFRD
jgi:hypothetical protein